MYKLLTASAVILIIVMFFIDTVWSKRIWTLAAMIISLAAVCRLPFSYIDCQKKIDGSFLQNDVKWQWMADYRKFFIVIVVLLAVYAVFIIGSYIHQKKTRDKQDFDGWIEYVVVFAAAVLAIFIHISGTVFVAAHTMKSFNLSYCAISATTAVNAVIAVTALLYIKRCQ